MSEIFKKLNLKDQAEIVVLHAPGSFLPELDALEGVTVHTSLQAAAAIDFLLAFVTQLAEIEDAARAVAEKARGDAVVWFAYPKMSSKKYTCEFNRDTGWDAVGRAGLEPVRQVAVDEDWSAVRFRRVQYIKRLTRGTQHRISEEGKARGQDEAPGG